MISRHPWIFIVIAFLILIGAWAGLVTLAVKHAPEQIEVHPQATPETQPAVTPQP